MRPPPHPCPSLSSSFLIRNPELRTAPCGVRPSVPRSATTEMWDALCVFMNQPGALFPLPCSPSASQAPVLGREVSSQGVASPVTPQGGLPGAPLAEWGLLTGVSDGSRDEVCTPGVQAVPVAWGTASWRSPGTSEGLLTPPTPLGTPPSVLPGTEGQVLVHRGEV